MPEHMILSSSRRSIETGIPRRTMLRVLGAAVLASIGYQLPLLARSADARQDATPGAAGTPTPFTGQGFVGEVTDVPQGEAFVAVVVGEATLGAEQRVGRALLYGDRENQINEWFTGEVAGEQLQLVSEGGAQLEGSWSPDGVTGTITMPDGSMLPIEAVPAQGIAGLYTVQDFPDGRVEGISEAGVKLIGTIDPQRGPDGGYPVTGTLTPPNGEAQPFEAILFTPELGTEKPPSRLVVLEDGRLLGGGRTLVFVHGKK